MGGWVSGQSWDSGWAGPGDKGLHPFVLLSSYQGPQLQLDHHQASSHSLDHPSSRFGQ